MIDLLNRDGDTCHLCRTPVDVSVRAPHPLAPSIDHVQPLTMGGGDDPFNVRVAHFDCNRRKGPTMPSAGDHLRPPTISSLDDSLSINRQLTKPPETRRCRWCGRPMQIERGPGRRREFCKPACRQMDYVARRRSAELGLSEGELVMTRAELDDLRDALYVVEAAVEDVDRDLATAGDDPAEVRRALDWLLQAVRPLLAQRP